MGSPLSRTLTFFNGASHEGNIPIMGSRTQHGPAQLCLMVAGLLKALCLISISTVLASMIQRRSYF